MTAKGQGRTAFAYLAPALLVLAGLLAYPIYQLVLISLYDYGQEQVSGGAPLTFLGLGNYQKLLGDQQFWTVFGQTVAFAAVWLIDQMRPSKSTAMPFEPRPSVPGTIANDDGVLASSRTMPLS